MKQQMNLSEMLRYILENPSVIIQRTHFCNGVKLDADELEGNRIMFIEDELSFENSDIFLVRSGSKEQFITIN